MATLKSGWLTTGPSAPVGGRFRIARPYAVAVNSGTAALHLALEAAGVYAAAASDRPQLYVRRDGGGDPLLNADRF